MNDRERVQRMLPFMEAYAQGLDVQVCGTNDGSWVSLPLNGRALFDGSPEDYRIKPQPREVWIPESHLVDQDDELKCEGRFFQPERFAIENSNGKKMCKFREVLDD